MSMKTLITALCILALSACASKPNVYSDQDPEQDFSVYKSFSWRSDNPMTVQSDYVISPLVEQRIKDAIISSLEAKGYIYTDDVLRADMGVSFTIGARDKIRVTQEPVSTVDSWRWGGQYWGLGGPIRPIGPMWTEKTRVYSQGTLAVDVFDMERKAPVWHGVSSKKLSSEQKAGQVEFVNAAVALTLQSFPAK